MYFACENGHLEVAKVLLAYANVLDTDNVTVVAILCIIFIVIDIVLIRIDLQHFILVVVKVMLKWLRYC